MNTIILKMCIISIVTAIIFSTVSYGNKDGLIDITGIDNSLKEKIPHCTAIMSLSEIQEDSIAEYEKFKKEYELKIKENEKRLAELKVKHENREDMENVRYQKKVNELEQKNNELKRRLTEYRKNQAKERWSAFKNEFKRDMDKLGDELKDLTSKDK